MVWSLTTYIINKPLTTFLKLSTLQTCVELRICWISCNIYHSHFNHPKRLFFQKLWAYVFAVNNLHNSKSHFYHEGQATRKPNEICSLSLDNCQEFFSAPDSCANNRNHTAAIRFFVISITNGRFNKILQHFSVRRHPYVMG